MQIPTVYGGSLEFIGTKDVFRHYLAISNELNTPKILACPLDMRMLRTNAFEHLSKENVSYFVGLDANEALPVSILAGDRNIVGGIVSNENTMVFNDPMRAAFTIEMHKGTGNVARADGSVSQVIHPELTNILAKSAMPVRLAIPLISDAPAVRSFPVSSRFLPRLRVSVVMMVAAVAVWLASRTFYRKLVEDAALP